MMMTMTMFSEFTDLIEKIQFGALLNFPVKVIFIGKHGIHKYLE